MNNNQRWTILNDEQWWTMNNNEHNAIIVPYELWQAGLSIKSEESVGKLQGAPSASLYYHSLCISLSSSKRWIVITKSFP